MADIGKAFSATWKKAAMIAVAWGVIASILGYIPIINAVSLLITVPMAFIVPIAVGYLVNQGKVEMGNAAITGGVAGFVYGVFAGIIGIVFAIINIVLGVGAAGALGSAQGAGSAAAGGIVGIILAVVIGLPVGIVLSIVLAAIGGIIYAATKK